MKAEVKQAFVKTLGDKYPGRSIFDVKELIDHANDMGLGYPNFITKPENRVGRGKYQIQMLATVTQLKPKEVAKVEDQPTATVKQTVIEQVKIEVPQKDAMYVSWGFFRDIKQIIEIGRAHV